MAPAIVSVIDHSKEAAARYLRRAGGNLRLPGESWTALSELGISSLERHRKAALLGAGSAALAAGSVYVVRRAGRPYADVLSSDHPYRVSRLEALRHDGEALDLVQRELQAEWGPFAPGDSDEMQAMVRNAGRMVFVIRFYEDGRLGPPSGVLQTALVEANGEPDQLVSLYPSFDAITGGDWSAAPSMRGDTAVLLQITAFGDRSRGVGSRLRDTALYMLPASVKWALTTTPVPPGFDLSSDPESSPPARFHFHGGARPAGYVAGYKTPPPERALLPAGRQSNRDVLFMRYRRLENDAWEGVERPDMRMRHHPIDLGLPRSVRAWRTHMPARQPVAA